MYYKLMISISREREYLNLSQTRQRTTEQLSCCIIWQLLNCFCALVNGRKKSTHLQWF